MSSFARKIKRNAQRQALKSNPNEIKQIFFGQDNEPITETLIAELTERGYKESDLKELQQMGAMYCRPRNSFVF